MAEPLKNAFDERVIRRIGAMLREADPTFEEAAFIHRATVGLEALELLDRGRHVARVMAALLPRDFTRAADVVIASLGPELERTEGNGMAPFLYLPHVVWVAENGLEHFEPSMRVQYELTKRFSAEFCIRPFLERYPEQTLARLTEWATDANVHVRRLVSEGTRPRLPWAPRLRALMSDPSPILPLLDLLKDDPEPYVRRSVANNVNDIAKDHPALAVEICERWRDGATDERRSLIRHALRSLIKRGDAGALAAIGYGASKGLGARGSVRPKRVRVGGTTRIEVTIENTTRRTQRAVVDLVVHFVKARGETAGKVFKLRAIELAPGEEITLGKTISFAKMTTRTHYAGRHAIEVAIDGRTTPIGAVDVTA